jgi:hypothetical protein
MAKELISRVQGELREYPRERWEQRVSERWLAICSEMIKYQPPRQTLRLNSFRKWELVSAYQKSIRRGDKEMALRLVSAIASMPEEFAYFWKRFSVIACEDVGPADDTLVSFVVACATVFPPKKTGARNYDLFCFLAEQMCDLSARSRIYCSYSGIGTYSDLLSDLSTDERKIVSVVGEWKTAQLNASSPWQRWQKKNDWRAAGLLKFVGLRLPLEMTLSEMPLPPYKMLFGLPSYCYDMYTRVGLTALRWMVQGVKGAQDIRQFFQVNDIRDARLALGEALFFEEGGRIAGELIYEPLCLLEQRLIAKQFSLSLTSWLQLRALAKQALVDGVIDRVREDILEHRYGGLFAIDCNGEGTLRNTPN